MTMTKQRPNLAEFFDKHGFEAERYAAAESSRSNAWERLWNYLEKCRLRAVDAINEQLPEGYRAEPHDVGSAHNECRIVIMDTESGEVVFSHWGDEDVPDGIVEALERADIYC